LKSIKRKTILNIHPFIHAGQKDAAVLITSINGWKATVANRRQKMPSSPHHQYGDVIDPAESAEYPFWTFCESKKALSSRSPNPQKKTVISM
jgi:hypothetical protein